MIAQRTLSPILLLAALAACTLPAAPARAAIGDIIDLAQVVLPSMLLTNDMLVEPGKDVMLDAGLRSGLRVSGLSGVRIQFLLGDAVLGESLTDKHGAATLPWKVPAKPGDYAVRVRVHPDDQPKKPIPPADLLVAARTADTPMIAVDLDKTIVESGFGHVLVGSALPMADAADVLTRMAKTHTIIYLTQRPDFLGPESKQWVVAHGFPRGPMLTTTLGTLVIGSGTYKSGRIEELRRTFKNLVAGVGDKFSDAKAYADNGLRPILLLRVKWSEADPEYFDKLARQLADLPDATQIVTSWSEVSAVLGGKLEYTRKAMETRLLDAAKALRLKPSKKD